MTTFYEVDSDGKPCNICNLYQCPACNHKWVDYWSCACDDECPNCGEKSISPVESMDADEMEEEDNREVEAWAD